MSEIFEQAKLITRAHVETLRPADDGEPRTRNRFRRAAAMVAVLYAESRATKCAVKVPKTEAEWKRVAGESMQALPSRHAAYDPSIETRTLVAEIVRRDLGLAGLQMGARRPAQIVAETIAVVCPYCGEPQPSPDNGSDAWLPKQLSSEAIREPRRQCVGCDAAFLLVTRSTAQVQP